MQYLILILSVVCGFFVVSEWDAPGDEEMGAQLPALSLPQATHIIIIHQIEL